MHAIERAGGRPLVVPPSEDSIEETLAVLDGIVFSGGSDLDPAHYGARAASGDRRARARCATGPSWRCSTAALERDMPVLAVCRGSQVLNVALGGDLVQHLPDALGHEGHRHTPGAWSDHDVKLEPESRVGSLLGERAPVKSHHHQGYGRIGEGLVEAGWADDGTVEALEDPSKRFAVGVLWHPEEGEDLALFEALVEEARGYREARAMIDRPATRRPRRRSPSFPPRGIEETDAAVAAAEGAFPAWRAVAPADRARLLRRLAALVEEHAEELALLETRNVGKPIADSRGEVGMVAEVFYFYAGAVDKHHGETIPVAGGVDMTFREPLGVVGLIVPWNFPIAISSWKLGPALACGNTVVLKPAELTPLTALRLAELALEAGIPEGVVNVVAGPGSRRRAAARRAPGRREDRLHGVDRGRRAA